MGLLKNKYKFIVTALLFLLSGCGGGGSSLDEPTPVYTPPPPPPVNSAPVCAQSGYANTLYCTTKRQNVDREFYVYLPNGMDLSNSQVPLLFSLHGYTSRALWNMGYSGFQSLADEDKFIAIYPQGTILPSTGETHWNVGGWTYGSPTDDVDFISSLIDWAYSEFKIDRSRVYSTGMSNGGYMSYHLACNLSSKIASVASVTGSMTPETYNSCSPNHPTAVMQIHGDVDTVVPYYGNWRSRSIPDVMEYWEEYNNCQNEDISILSDVNNDGDGGFLFNYDQCLDDVEVTLYLMSNMGHEWPRYSNGNDIVAAEIIWNFFKQYDINGKIIE